MAGSGRLIIKQVLMSDLGSVSVVSEAMSTGTRDLEYCYNITNFVLGII